MDLEIERATILAFFKPERRARYLGLIESAKGRRKVVNQLAHFRELDERFRRPLPKGLNRWEMVAELLSQRGARPTCYVISEETDVDGATLELNTALAAVYGSGMGTILSCIPGKLAYYEGEYMDESCILERHNAVD